MAKKAALKGGDAGFLSFNNVFIATMVIIGLGVAYVTIPGAQDIFKKNNEEEKAN